MAEQTSPIPSFTMHYGQKGASKKLDELGMREMQTRAYENRGEQFLLIKSPPASGKSRALMFIALDKVFKQGLKRAIIIVPERAIGASFNDAKLSEHGFWTDWTLNSRYNLTNAPEENKGTIALVGEFLKATAEPLTAQEKTSLKANRFLLCTHATFRFAVEQYGIEAFDDSLIAIDEFHHVSANPDNVTGKYVKALIAREKTHLVAMTGSYFRGDADAILLPEDEARFKTVTYTYYEQLNGYDHLKTLNLGYFFYSGVYLDDLMKVLNPNKKTILYIPNVNARESTKDKYQEVDKIIDQLGTWMEQDEITGFIRIKTKEGKTLKIADLVDDDPKKRNKVITALKDPAHTDDKDHVDIIIALGMAKEGFDWIWCEHALAVGYRASLTEVVQIIGRATRDAKGKDTARFTNLISEPDAAQQLVREAVNDTLKAIAASLLMQQVMAPRFDFEPKKTVIPVDSSASNLTNGQIITDDKGNVVKIIIHGLKQPSSTAAKHVCKQDIPELIAQVLQDNKTVEKGMFDRDGISQDITQIKFGEIIRNRYPNIEEEDQEAIRQHLTAAMYMAQHQGELQIEMTEEGTVRLKNKPDQIGSPIVSEPNESGIMQTPNTQFIDNAKLFSLDVRELNIDLIDSVNPFAQAYNILSKGMTAERLQEIEALIGKSWEQFTPEEALEYALRAEEFVKRYGREPDSKSADPWEKKLADGTRAFTSFYDQGKYKDVAS